MNLRHLSFRLLQVYQEVIRQGSITAAARELHLTQPTVSMQLKKLSELVGEPLLETRDGRLKPTDIGRELYQASADVFTRFNDFNTLLAESREGWVGHINIGLVTTAKYVMPRILGAFYRQFPRVEVTLNIGNRAHVLNRFEQQKDDLYLFSHPPSGEQVRAARIIQNPLQLIAPSSHWAAGQSQLDFSQLSTERFLIREPGSASRMMFESWLSRQGYELSRTMQIESNEAIRLSVASGLGLSVISGHTLQEGKERPVVLDVEGFPLKSHWYLVSRRDLRMSYVTAQLVTFIAEHLTECIEADWVAEDLSKVREWSSHSS
ncbi:MAG: LysR family transcriptional regulator [Shewanella sp.]|nr:LysR family transcriptional regulator [Shewanella sp.]MCF1431439.1 LysR family transcriptional regulator [Shewanella sp.]MCF1439021.1 LysR family transcriptional regulator [Shewanella sp.]MCF1457375.1 LysR family transcriptional regulator [Shewanella sp.]